MNVTISAMKNTGPNRDQKEENKTAGGRTGGLAVAANFKLSLTAQNAIPQNPGEKQNLRLS